MALPRQRPTQLRRILAITELTKDDLARLQEPRRAVVVKKLRDSHHHLARLFAAGCDNGEVARRTGYTYQRVKRIRESPAFKQLVEEYRAMVNETWLETVDDYQEIMLGNMIRAELQIADKLAEAEDNEETLPTRELMSISRDAADRMGYGKKSTNVNVNVDFAAQLEKAVRRSAAARIVDVGPSTRGVPERPALAVPLLAREHSQEPRSPVVLPDPAVESVVPLFRRRV